VVSGSPNSRGQQPLETSGSRGRNAQLQEHRSGASAERQHRDARDDLGLRRSVTERETEWDVVGHAVVDRAEAVRGNRAQRTPGRLLGIDDVGPAIECGLYLARVSYAHQQLQLASPL
jgi:hypothetical protein